MGKILQNVWILTKTGSVVFHRKFDPIIDEQLFGAIISSLNTFAETGLFENNISNFVISDKIIYLKKRNDLLFVTDSSEKTKEKKIEKELDKIIEKFFEAYPPETFINWDCNVKPFSCFEETIQDSLKDFS